jgi:hypothetical protein
MDIDTSGLLTLSDFSIQPESMPKPFTVLQGVHVQQIKSPTDFYTKQEGRQTTTKTKFQIHNNNKGNPQTKPYRSIPKPKTTTRETPDTKHSASIPKATAKTTTRKTPNNKTFRYKTKGHRQDNYQGNPQHQTFCYNTQGHRQERKKTSSTNFYTRSNQDYQGTRPTRQRLTNDKDHHPTDTRALR